mmetsp:Transcript_49738/g.98356  ORF Transcript_49738/g.98356 Transcript_49738/m.98356 type:complete len:155 (+) Transcript_49738:187-651(+)
MIIAWQHHWFARTWSHLHHRPRQHLQQDEEGKRQTEVVKVAGGATEAVAAEQALLARSQDEVQKAGGLVEQDKGDGRNQKEMRQELLAVPTLEDAKRPGAPRSGKKWAPKAKKENAKDSARTALEEEPALEPKEGCESHPMQEQPGKHQQKQSK